ncbi:geranylgeranyl diphosphate synthase type I [Methanomicrobium sp. W14]|uniref:polyprenyl synthetase family protein n=1 Tax=Methanomicrobium sp. W14 TaxID=2817839 RepID=UPI001AE37727|nr:polyprenyl synthetase family protein [Methanomicrobium sp. W14]MBP2132113.1 geranylgeranyl diphosphate synthase type I [Methanomicrobium sp. W14]
MKLEEYLESVAEDVDLELNRLFGSAPGELNKASAHLLLAGGKRLRPAVVILAADIVKNGSSREIFPAALALEVTHTFTLVHDDIMDDDSQRRGVPTVHCKWNMPTAVLAGDVLYAEAFELITRAIADSQAKVLSVEILARTCVEICQGQHEDMTFEDRNDVLDYEYIDMVGKKTGKLYAAAAAIGGTLAGGNVNQVQALHDWGYNSGIAFQIQDDLIDLLSTSDKSGKDRASDLREGKQTIVAIKAREAGVDLSKYRKPDLTDAEIDEAIALLEKSGVISEVKKNAQKYVTRAKEMLEGLPDCDERKLLGDITDYFISRCF